MNRPNPDRDPGWGAVLRAWPKIMIPVVGMRSMIGQGSGLQSMRFVCLAFVSASSLVWLPVVWFGATENAPLGVSAGIAATAIAGVFAQLLGPRFIPDLDVASPATLAHSIQRTTFLRIGLASVGVWVGFVAFLFSGAWLSYAVGYVVALAGLWDAAPRTPRLQAFQQQVRDAGSNLKVIRVLNQTTLTR